MDADLLKNPKEAKNGMSMAESQPGAGHKAFGLSSPVTHFYQI